MKQILLASLLALAGCMHVQSERPVGVLVEPVPGACLSPLIGYDTRIAIINRSDQTIAFSSYGSSGPPYALFPDVFLVLAAEPLTQEFSLWEPVLEHSMPPSHDVRLSPGDRAEFTVGTSGWPSPDSNLLFKLQVLDTQGRSYLSEAVQVCQPR